MNNLKRLTLIICILSGIQQSELRADHFMGGNITYETIDLDTNRGIYRIKLKLERPCNSFNTFNPDYQIKVLEYDSKRNPGYGLSIYVAKLYDSNYIYNPCTSPSSTCSNSSGQIIEVKYYRVDIVVQNTKNECLVFFDDNAARTKSDNLKDDDDPLILYTSFIPRYNNTQIQMEETKRHFPLKNKLAEVTYNLIDSEGDSISFNTSIPTKAINYTTNGQNLAYTFLKSNVYAGLNDNRPFAIQETSITKTMSSIRFTPSVEQRAWLSIIKSEFRKINTGIKDTWVCISKSNQDRLFNIFNINSQFRLSETFSSSTAVKLNGNNVTICNNGLTNTILFKFPIETSVNLSQYKVFLGSSNISPQFILNRKLGSGGIDTILLSLNYAHSGHEDLASNLHFDFNLCHTATGIGFDRSFISQFNVFNYKVFNKDTILSCANSLSLITLLQKPLNLNWGIYTVSNKTISISNPKDTWLIAHLQSPNSLCPSKDSIYINQGSIFSLTTIGYMPSCKGYADASAKVSVIGSNGPFTYRWSNSSILDSISSIFAGQHTIEVSDKDNCKQVDTLIISEPQGIDAKWVTDSAITCYGGSNGYGHIEIISSIKPTQYTWTSILSIDSFLTQVSAGSYSGSYRYTNLSSKICDQSFTFEVKQPDSIYLHIVSTDNTCFGESKGKIAIIPLGGHGDFLFYFNNQESNIGYKERLSNGVVNIYAKDGKNCTTSIYPISIKSPDKLKYNLIISNPSCTQVANGTISINHATGGVLPYSYSFNLQDYSSVSSFNNLGVGTYTLKMRDANNCLFIQNLTLSPSYVLKAKPDLIADSKCPLSHSGKIYLEISNGKSPYKVFLANDSLESMQTYIRYNDLRKGNYNIKIIDHNGCAWLSQYQINEPDTIKLNSIVRPESCFNMNDGSITSQVVNGGTSPYKSFKWYNAANSLIASSQSISPGDYFLRFEDDNNCKYEYSFLINKKSQIKSNLKILQPIKCYENTNGILEANPIGGMAPYTYFWRNYSQISSNTLSNLSAGKYYLTLTDKDNCFVLDSITITQPNPLRLEYLKLKNADCPNTPNGGINILCLNADGSEDYLQYKLKNKSEYNRINTFTNLDKGVYTVLVKDSAGCEKEFGGEIKTDKALEVQLAQNLTLEIGQEYQLSPNMIYGESTQLSDITGYDWNPKSSLSCTDCLSPKFTATKSETYTVNVSYGKECRTSASVYLEVSKAEDVYIPNSFSPNGDDKNDIWQVHGKNIIGFDAKIYNRVGELVYTSTDIQKGWDGTYKGSKETSNTYKYLIKVTYTDKSQRSYEGSLNLFR